MVEGKLLCPMNVTRADKKSSLLILHTNTLSDVFHSFIHRWSLQLQNAVQPKADMKENQEIEDLPVCFGYLLVWRSFLSHHFPSHCKERCRRYLYCPWERIKSMFDFSWGLFLPSRKLRSLPRYQTVWEREGQSSWLSCRAEKGVCTFLFRICRKASLPHIFDSARGEPNDRL